VVVLQVLVAVAVLLLPVPALVLGLRGLLRRPGYTADDPGDRASVVVIITLRVLTLLLMFALSAVTLVSAVGALVKSVELHGLVYVFLGLDLLLALLVLITFGRRDRRRVRRPASPAAR
jgi:hypothetical protein